jgi:thiol-disulfide isomerase/thioredoxin
MGDPEQTPAPGDDQSAGTTTAPAPRQRRRGPEIRIGLPGWVPFAFVAVFALGVALGAVLVVVIDDGDTAAAAPPTTSPPPSAPNADATSPVLSAPDVGGDDPLGFGTVELSGTPLPRLAEGGTGDPAVGMPAPGLRGADFEGAPVSIEDDGRAKIIVFLAHWCPYCRQEVPTIRDWVDTTAFPEEVDVYSVSTLTDPSRTNYPPATWFALEGWNVPLLADDGADTAANAFGLNAVPFWVLVNQDNTVAGRGAGAVPVEILDQVVADLAAGSTQ